VKRNQHPVPAADDEGPKVSRTASPVRSLITLGAAALLLAGCTAASSAAGSTPTPATDLAAVTVTGGAGAAPTVDFGRPFSATRTGRRILTTGTGAAVVAGQRVSVDYVGVNGTDGKVFDSSYGKKPATFMVDPKQVIKGFANGLLGVTVGSRILLAVPPTDGYGIQGQPAAGIGPTDTLLFVIDVKSANQVLTRATGTRVTPPKGLPTVKLDAKGKPTITLPGGAPPASLVVQPLILGKGPKVAAKQTITVHYTGVVWPGGRQFDSSWTSRRPAQFPIGAGQVIAGWDQGLVGRPVGSQLLMIIPPDQGYGAAGNSQAGIKGTDTLVFVVDILDAV
jgi:peptidylprolyl isomerase